MMTINELCINTVRAIGVEAITKAKSGHPGIVLGSAPIMHTLFTRHMELDPKDSNWANRDRFILSAGHGSALLYTMYHFAGFKISMEDLKNFRQKGSLTPGHPEYKHTDGVEMTTGPLGQGLSTAVGMALAEAYLNNKFGDLVNHYTYVLCGDGDLQEGVTQEAMSLAGHLKLNKLIVLYDSNDIQLDGEVANANSENVEKKYTAMNWNYIRVSDGNNIDEVDKAIASAKKSLKPTIIEIKTIIGYGAKNQGTSAVHGKPLSVDELAILKSNLGITEPDFVAPSEVYDFYNETIALRGSMAHSKWNELLKQIKETNKALYDEYEMYMSENVKLDLSSMPKWEVGSKDSTRNVMGKVLNWIQQEVPYTIGGSADLTSSTKVMGVNGIYSPDHKDGRDIRFGVREHAMACITNGITLHGGLRAFCAGFFVFSDYLKPAVRLAAIMKLNSLFFFSHDTVNVGEDGPTHQPVEQLTMFRSIPNVNVFRPADATEMSAALVCAYETKNNPTVIVSTRQDCNNLASTNFDGVKKGAYIAYEPATKPEGVLVTCGSELDLCIKAAASLQEEGVAVRVVSMPSMYLFEMQSDEYKEMVLPKMLTKRLAVEMGSSMPWYKYSSNVVGIDVFGASMPLKYIAEEYGFTVENVVNRYKNIK